MSEGVRPVVTSKRVAALETENKELRQAIECRSARLSQLAHELRTPLTSILGFTEILLTQEELTAAQRNFCERIQSSALQMHANLNQLSEISQWLGERSETPKDRS